MFDLKSRPSIVLSLGEPVITDLTAFRLQLLGYETVLCETAGEAIASINVRPPSLLLIGTTIGDQDGLSTLAKIRRDYTPVQLPVMVVTMDPSLDTVRMAYQSGAQEYLITPFDPTVLEFKVAALIASIEMPEANTSRKSWFGRTAGGHYASAR